MFIYHGFIGALLPKLIKFGNVNPIKPSPSEPIFYIKIVCLVVIM